MTRSLRVFYIALFLVTLMVLGLWSVRSFFGFSTNNDATVLNGRWAKAVETHYDDEFPIKRLGTNLWAALDFKLFNEGRPGVVLGRDQWLYSDEEFHPIVNEELNLQGNYALVEGVRQALKEKGVKLVMAIVPAKVRLYPEHLGDVQPASIHANLYQDFHARVAADKILAPDLLGPLQQAKQNGQQVFLRTDTHWTPAGAEVAANQLAKAIADKAPLMGQPQRFVTEAEQTVVHKGDLRLFLPLDPLFENLMPAKEPLQKRVTRAADDQPAADDALFADNEVPVALVGTSYSANPNWNFVGALKQALHSDVVSYAEDGHGPVLPMLSYLKSDAFKNSPPQVLIWEFPERYLPVNNDIGDADPQWVAELKQAGARQQNVAALNKSETPDRAQN
ncbi:MULTISPECIES: alginate O-acetyltransferase [Pseudomonas]|uniref:Probable alginate O-acetylase AlgJ n=3 Tax=Pseudomonas chlororaphis TaxID=587753 RepID=A0AAP9W1I0_9PSED|nr:MULTISPECIES: alginate O-acetyltransferase [Pseudomonas]AIC18160.1 alginate O-acetyltransferase [Pseudomonas chlororaphis]AUG39266.1 alginate O-acetyltransferase [Pseudomonas chlororaphis]AZD83876.1 Alginate O-acetyltransferase AlgJ, inner membrane [Pseudomonas chlororaphis subsp. aureofaciens]AZD90492.1 Alginate O-acetyltransferase AlgJ, inner membrane [Pseudomonas chlororaphis subsp. aureofaciens]AZD96960.1 Alginate O-acetyltransferase AlgJ, inner membrane [Pseudomonas chlororaphis subsp.